MPEKTDGKEKTNPAEELKKTDQDISREEKLLRLAEAGVELFPRRADRTHSVFEAVRQFAALPPEELDQRKVDVVVPGRILSIRKMGRATFATISDSRAKVQIYLRKEEVGPEAYDLWSLMDIGDLVSVGGSLFKTRTGELTVHVRSWTFLAKCLHPLPEKWHGLQDVELRYRRRYLDLIMSPEVGETFRLRSRMIAEIRRFFDSRGYVEVETPMMQPIPGGALARPFKTFHNALGIDLYLRIAPELYLKRLIVGGMEKVYEINRNFRNEGISSEHNPEFTMLEFYEAYSDYHDMMNLTEELLHTLCLTLLQAEEFPYGEERISFRKPFARLKYKEAIVGHSGLAPERFINRAEVMAFAAELGGEGLPLSHAKALDLIFDKLVKPRIIQPTFITHIPKEISPLAKASSEDPDETDRFELIVAGMEIANAFSELSDPQEQRRRFEQQAEEKKQGVEESHWVDLDYVQALEYGLPPTGGEGIGIDRLTMLLADRKSIREVILFPLLRPK
ncbi:MAG: lysine--tRNA ligase [Candidatus Aminicenantes bacterium]|nr:lysine--tRNA ligase [Candidatus Aminicenantes bacterium]